MKFKRFIINNYRAIKGPLEINIEKTTLMPIIGINESGKTTILHAIFSFDYANDKLNEGLHLVDIYNLYDTNHKPPIISAEIDLDWDMYIHILNTIAKNHVNDESIIQKVRSYKKNKNQFKGSILIYRNLIDLSYGIDGDSLYKDESFNAILARTIISHMPYILYFDDFRDSVAERIEIKNGGDSAGWLEIIQTFDVIGFFGPLEVRV